MTALFDIARGDTPVVVNIPHAGIHLPADIEARLTPAARTLPDTDWHVDRLYEFTRGLGATVLAATHSRYVVDLNRDPTGRALYPGQANTGLCPTETFDGVALYEADGPPDEAEIRDRLDRYWRPYHATLAETLTALRDRHGVAVLFDAHSIRSRCPRLFEGRLPDFNLGSAGGASAGGDLVRCAHDEVRKSNDYTHVLNGRFKGGFITRHYGRPGEGIHALQLEMTQACYMDEAPPFGYREDLARGIRPVLEDMVRAVIGWTEGRKR